MQYPRLTDAATSELRRLTAPERVITDPTALADYGRDESTAAPRLPEAAVKPLTTDEVAAVIRICAEERIPVTPRGLGTGLSGGAVPVKGGIVLALELLRRLEVDPANLTLRTGPGNTTEAVQQAAAARGLYYPVDPASLADCSIGGNVAENAGGARAFKYGVTGDYVRGIEAVLADGSTIRWGGDLHKNVTGYDLNRLLIGSEGTLAVITGITLKLIPRPRCLVDLLIPFERMSQGLELVSRMVHDQRLVPAVVEFIERKGICAANQVLGSALPFPDAEVQVLIELDGNDRNRVLDDCVAIGELAMSLGAREPLVADNPTDQDRLWHARRELHELLKKVYAGLSTEDVVVPLSRIPELIAALAELERQHSVPIVPWGHIGDGNIHVGMCRTDGYTLEAWQQKRAAIVDDLTGHVLKLGGQISAEHGIGLTKKRLMTRAYPPADPTRSGGTALQPLLSHSGWSAELALMARLKKGLDPDNILNPGKILPD